MVAKEKNLLSFLLYVKQVMAKAITRSAQSKIYWYVLFMVQTHVMIEVSKSAFYPYYRPQKSAIF